MKHSMRQSGRGFSSSRRILGVFALAFAAGACSSDDKGNGDTTQSADLTEDTLVGTDIPPDDDTATGDTAPSDDANADDATTGSDDGPNPDDAANDKLTRGEPCLEHDDCASDWCVPTSIGVVCVDVCVETCEGTDRCVRSQTGSSDDIYLCLPWNPTGPIDPNPGSDTVSGTDGLISNDSTTIGQDGSQPSGDATPSDTTIPGDVAQPGDSTNPPTDGGGTVGDRDGDGIPDDEDLIPCLGFEIIVYNQGVTAASINMNGTEIVSSGSFPTTQPIRRTINPAPGVNELDLGGKLTGSPQDLLSIFIVSTDGTVWFETLFVRVSGPPRAYTTQFVLDIECN